ncbi:MAG: low temperature requirement protein A [Microthrixaceae bacterium]
MDPRAPEEAHRVATPLELFVDLAFVVAVAQAASSFHHALVDGDTGAAFNGFPLVFFAIWWAWMNFTWFASAYDNDDVFYRLATFVQMAGVLVLAAGVPRSFHHSDITVVTYGYVIMRLAMVSQWLRAASSDPGGRTSALRYAGGISVMQIGWLLRLTLPDRWALPSILVLIAGELSVPYWAESAGRTAWHPRHIADRYGGFTIIVLGESVLSATFGVQAALDAHSSVNDLLPVILGGLLVAWGMWWFYFAMPGDLVAEHAKAASVERVAATFAWGYGHYFVFAAAALTGAGVAVEIDQVRGQSKLSDLQAGLVTTIPVAVFLLVVWLLHYAERPRSPFNSLAVPVAVLLVLASAVSPEPLLFAGLVLAALTAASIVATAHDWERTSSTA